MRRRRSFVDTPAVFCEGAINGACPQASFLLQASVLTTEYVEKTHLLIGFELSWQLCAALNTSGPRPGRAGPDTLRNALIEHPTISDCSNAIPRFCGGMPAGNRLYRGMSEIDSGGCQTDHSGLQALSVDDHNRLGPTKQTRLEHPHSIGE